MVGYVVDAKIRASDKDLTVLDSVHKAGKGCVSLTTYQVPIVTIEIKTTGTDVCQNISKKCEK